MSKNRTKVGAQILARKKKLETAWAGKNGTRRNARKGASYHVAPACGSKFFFSNMKKLKNVSLMRK